VSSVLSQVRVINSIVLAIQIFRPANQPQNKSKLINAITHEFISHSPSNFRLNFRFCFQSAGQHFKQTNLKEITQNLMHIFGPNWNVLAGRPAICCQKLFHMCK